jgi:hypothetical protein
MDFYIISLHSNTYQQKTKITTTYEIRFMKIDVKKIDF